MSSTLIPWPTRTWTTPPKAVEHDGGDLLVTAREESDAWRITSYGFIHDTEHALVTDLPVGTAIEVVFTADFREQFDQAGLFVVASKEEWVKAGVEFADGHPQVGAVVTHGHSDWSVAPVDGWAGRRVRVRVSRGDDALTVRAGIDGEPLALVRVAYWPGHLTTQAGPFTCAPTRAGLTVRFHEWLSSEADGSLH